MSLKGWKLLISVVLRLGGRGGKVKGEDGIVGSEYKSLYI
jgi:hypothetical protein